jgi:hypothetical protein
MIGQALMFDGVDIEDSIVLGWALSDNGLAIQLEVSLLPEHAEYAKSPPEERGCFKRGELLFPLPRDVMGLKAQQDVVPSGEEAGMPDYDTFHCLRLLGPDRFYVEGEFGEVQLTSAWPTLILHGGASSRARPTSHEDPSPHRRA